MQLYPHLLDYDARGNMTRVQNDDGVTLVTSTYNQYGEVTSSTGAAGTTTYFDYDSGGDQVASWHFEGTGPDQVQILDRTFYDEAGRTTGTARAVLPAGQFVTSNLAAAVIDPQYVLWTTSTTYNLAGQVAASTDRYGNVTENTYDVRGQLVQTRTQSADAQGNPAWLLTRTVYDAAGRATHRTDQYVEGTTEPVRGTVTTYDAAGRVSQSEQVLGLAIGLVGTGALVTSVATDLGTATSSSATQYDTAGRVTVSTDRHGLETRTTYNRFGEVVETRTQAYDAGDNPVWLVSRTVYDDHGRVSVATDRYQEQQTSGQPVYGTQTIYDDLGRAVKTVRLEDVQVDMVDPATGLPVDPVTSQLSTLNSQLADPGTELYSTETIYNAKGRVARTIQPDGRTTDYEYDTLGRQTATIGQAVPAESVGLTPPAGATHVSLRTETVYDSQGRVQTQRTNVYQFDDGTIDASAAQETSFEYDEFGNRTKTTFDDGTFITTAYDPFGRKISETNQLGETRTFEYDAAGRLAAVELPAVPDPSNGNQPTNPRYEYAYDAAGNQTLIRDPLSRDTTFTYDAAGRRLSRTLPLGQTEQTRYNDRGQLELEVSFEGVVTEYVYDADDGRLAEKRFFDNLTAYDDGNGSPAEVTAYTYDAFGRHVQVVQDRDGDLLTTTDQRVTSNSYDDLGRLVTVAAPEGTVHYEYDALGRRTRTYTGAEDTAGTPAAGDGIAVTDTVYTYDALGRLDAVTVVERFDTPLATPEVTDYVYDLLGNLDQVRLPGAVVSDYDYDQLNRLTLLRQFNDDGDFVWESGVDTLLAEYDYDLLADGKRSGVTETDDQGQETRIDWLYDAVGRLTRESYDSHDNSLDFITGYTFDLVGNRLAKKTDTDPTFVGDPTFDETITYTYDANDRLVVETLDSDNDGTTDQTTTYGYNATQQTSKTVTDSASSVASVVNYSYNLQGRMSTVTIDSNGDALADTQLEYEYNDRGIRTAQTKTTDGNADGDFDDLGDTSERTEYVIDEQNPTGYAQVLEEWAAGTLAKTYTIGPDVFAEAAAAATVRRLLKDGHGSTRMLVDAAGLPLSNQVYRFDAYGNAIGFDPATALTTLLYNSEPFDSLTGLTYLRARYYDLSSGRFTRLDPFFGNLHDPQSLHKYLFVHGGPINGIDPSGLWSITGVVTGLTIGMTVTSMALPVMGAAYLSAVGKVSFTKIVGNLMEPETWLKASTGLVVGAGTSMAIQGATLKLGKEISKKITPGLGLVFAVIGLGQSIRLTHQMLTQQLPPHEAEEYVATLVAGSILSSLLGWKARQWAKQATNDSSYWQMSPQDQQSYNTGQQLLPSRVFERLAGMSPVQRGRYLEGNFNAAQRTLLRVQGFFESVVNFGHPGEYNTWDWVSSGLTPDLRYVLGENYLSVVSAIAAALHLSQEVTE